MLVNTGQVADNGNPIYRQNGRVKSQGVEFDVKGNLLPFLNISANYAFNITEVMESDLKLEKGMVNANAPKHLASIWAKYTQRDGALQGLGIGLGGQYVDNIDAAIFKQLTEITVYLGAFSTIFLCSFFSAFLNNITKSY